MRAETDVLTVANQAAGCAFTLELTGSLAAYTEQLTTLLTLRKGRLDKAPLIRIGDDKDEDIQDYVPQPQINPIFDLRSADGVDVFTLSTDRQKHMTGIALWQILHCIALILAREVVLLGGLPVHSALLAKGGRAVVAAGRSGAGKTTLGQNAPAAWSTLADDYAFMAASGSGYLAFPYMTISQCLEKKDPRPCDPGITLPLAGLFFLDQAAQDEINPMPAAEAVMALYGSAATILRFYYRDFHTNSRLKDLRKRLFDNACDIIKAVPAYRMRVSRRNQIWPLLQETLDNDHPPS